jgi:polyisoprenoid-binding protein YceI
MANNPAPGTYELDPTHTLIEAVARHMVVTKVRGRFKDFSGRIEVGETPETSSVEVEIDAASIDTGVEQRDQHLRSGDFLDTHNHPKITFKSTKVERVSDTELKVTGDLSIRGITKPITLDAAFEGSGVNPWGAPVLSFSASGDFAREDWGITWNQALETGGVLVSKVFALNIEVEAQPAQQVAA